MNDLWNEISKLTSNVDGNGMLDALEVVADNAGVVSWILGYKVLELEGPLVENETLAALEILAVLQPGYVGHGVARGRTLEPDRVPGWLRRLVVKVGFEDRGWVGQRWVVLARSHVTRRVCQVRHLRVRWLQVKRPRLGQICKIECVFWDSDPLVKHKWQVSDFPRWTDGAREIEQADENKARPRARVNRPIFKNKIVT